VLRTQPLLTKPLTSRELIAVAVGFARAHEGWRHQILFDAADRYSFCLHVDDVVDVWLCTWLPGQRTGLHDHGESAGAVAVVLGQLTEQRLARGRIGRRRLRAGHSASVTPVVVHDVGNRKRKPAVSIHAYSPPLSRMSFYDRAGRTALTQARTVELMPAATWDALT
jgi:predicted metal-dependent enzyme (double-stranded beta helix superfamily)